MPKDEIIVPRSRSTQAAIDKAAKPEKPKAQPKGEGPLKRLNVEIPEALHNQLKAKAASKGKKLREYVVEMIKADLRAK